MRSLLRAAKLLRDIAARCDFCLVPVRNVHFYLKRGSGLICGECFDHLIPTYGEAMDEIEATKKLRDKKRNNGSTTNGSLLHIIPKSLGPSANGGARRDAPLDES